MQNVVDYTLKQTNILKLSQLCAIVALRGRTL